MKKTEPGSKLKKLCPIHRVTTPNPYQQVSATTENPTNSAATPLQQPMNEKLPLTSPRNLPPLPNDTIEKLTHMLTQQDDLDDKVLSPEEEEDDKPVIIPHGKQSTPSEVSNVSLAPTNNTPSETTTPVVPKKDEITIAEQTYDAQDHLDHDDSASVVSAGSSFADLAKYRSFQIVLDMICVASHDPVCITDINGMIKTINQEFLGNNTILQFNMIDLFEYKRWEVVKLIMPEKYSKHHDGYLKRYHKGKMKRIIGEKRDKIAARKKTGVEFPIVLKVSELSSGNDTAYIGVIKNVSFDEELVKIKEMLSNMLPRDISDKIQQGESEIADEVEGTVVFIDLVEFTKGHNSARKVVNDLNQIFKAYDDFCEQFSVEKIKTIGDAYMAVCSAGILGETFDYPIRVLEMCLKVLEYTKKTTNFEVRIGVATGPMVQGVLSGAKLSYDIWGDTVNMASRLQNLADKGRIIVDYRTHQMTHFKYLYEAAKKQEVKGKGEVDTYLLVDKKNTA